MIQFAYCSYLLEKVREIPQLDVVNISECRVKIALLVLRIVNMSLIFSLMDCPGWNIEGESYCNRPLFAKILDSYL